MGGRTGARMKTMTDLAMKVEALRQQGLALIRNNQIEESLALFDEALELSEDETTRELLVINKAGAHISLEKSSPEVQQLPQIVMRRRNLRHVYVASYNLQHKFLIERNFQRSAFYGKIALQAADESGEASWRSDVLIALGNACVYDSRIPDAITYYSETLELLSEEQDVAISRAFCTQNLGYCFLLQGDLVEGIALIHEAVQMISAADAAGYLAEPYIDLCYGYLELGDVERAIHFGEMGLDQATEVRQVRNAHYLLGEAAYKTGDTSRAEYHFEHLAKFYPDFPHLKDLLFALDLRSMVNLKL